MLRCLVESIAFFEVASKWLHHCFPQKINVILNTGKLKRQYSNGNYTFKSQKYVYYVDDIGLVISII